MTEFDVIKYKQGSAEVIGEYLVLHCVKRSNWYDIVFDESRYFGEDAYEQTTEKFLLIQKALEENIITEKEAMKLTRSTVGCGYCLEHDGQCETCFVRSKCHTMSEINNVHERLEYALKALAEMEE